MNSRHSWLGRLFAFLLFSAVILLYSPAQAQPEPPPEMIYIPQGYFQMGTSSGKEDEKPMHLFSLPAILSINMK